ncbi:MAG: STAS domain-containing protein [Planctomycetota bacterium]
MAVTSLDIKQEQQGNRLIFRAQGHITSQTLATTILTAVAAVQGVEDVIIILDEVEFINSEGFGALIHVTDQLESRGQTFNIVGLRKKVQVVFSSLGASNVMNLFPNLEMCLDHLDTRKK